MAKSRVVYVEIYKPLFLDKLRGRKAEVTITRTDGTRRTYRPVSKASLRRLERVA